MSGRALLLQRIVGCLYIVAGIAKFFPRIESVETRLDNAAESNTDTFMEGATDWLARHPTGVMWFVALTMVAAGAAMLWNQRALVVAALYGQLLMLVSFVAILVTSEPQILVLDAAFFAAAIYLLYRYHAHRPEPAVAGRTTS
ncbi:DUF6041 domain-containing protein [Streptomyces sp. NBC_01283]|uniref:DUF6041 domain-containing protein n=1 Tax=Streptomyces sp. NBC_01283 TaxID=2903812 RepID=UPI00352E92BB|nr:DUF6041 domain-containing protein [Streptomyces sp. NBC_01283]